MNERKRIFDLVKQGVISTEEALVLLENIAKETGGRVKPSEDDISPKDWFISSDRSLDDESSMDAIDELTQLENLEHQIDEINIQLIELNETLQLEESAELLQQKRTLQNFALNFPQASPFELELSFAFFTSGAISLIKYWLEEDSDYPIEKIVQLLIQLTQTAHFTNNS